MFEREAFLLVGGTDCVRPVFRGGYPVCGKRTDMAEPALSERFGDLLLRHRLTAGLSQEELAERAGLSRRGISDLERGARRPHPGTARRLADALELGAEDRDDFVGANRVQAPAALRSPPFESNLRSALSSFIGRERELAEVRALLQTARLLTLTGTGGVGKTRLALEVIRDAAAEAKQRVCLVELAPIAECSAVARATAEVLGIPEQPGRNPLHSLRDALRSEELLLILDNCEQVLQGCADLSDALLSRCPGVRILATSRERLGITGEVLWRVPPLLVPSEGMSLGQLKSCDAIRLFADRAAALLPKFVISDQNAPALARVCARLDGIPLAIELAAAQVPVLSIEQISDRLDHALQLLVQGSRVAPPRQQTLRATVDWSYGLLDRTEQLLLDRLSIFAGGWTLEAAEEVCTDSDESENGVRIGKTEVVGVLARLVAKSLVVADHGEEAHRFHLLETLRQFAAERLQLRGETNRLRCRHAMYYAAWAERVHPAGWAPNPFEPWPQIAAELGNVRAALRWLIDHREVEVAQRLAGAMAQFWRTAGAASEGRAWLDEIHSLADRKLRTRSRLRILIAAGSLASEQADYSAAQASLEEALDLARELGDERATATTLYQLATLAWYRRDFLLARTLCAEALQVSRAAGLHQHAAVACWLLAQVAHDLRDSDAAALANEALTCATEADLQGGIALVLTTLAQIHRSGGDLDTARALLDRASAIHPARIGGVGVLTRVWIVCNLGRVATQQGDLVTAHANFLDALVIARDNLGGRGRLGMPLEGLAQVAAASGRPIQAFRVAGAAAVLRETYAVPAAPSERVQLEQWLSRARTSIGARAADAAWHAGRRLTAEEAIAEALSIDIDSSQANVVAVNQARPSDGLTTREREIAMLIAGGLGTRQIAERLVIAEGTVRVHVERILSKLSLHSRTQLAAWAVHQGHVPVRPS